MAELKDVLRRIIKEMDDEDTREEFEQLRNRKVTWAEITEAVREAPAEERAQLRAILLDEGVDPGTGKPLEDGDDDDGDKPDPPKRKPKEKKPSAAPSRRTRPGRRSGAAYDWYVDDDGNVVRSPVAVVYSGEDEPDEVEMLPEDDAGDPGDGDDGDGGDGE